MHDATTVYIYVSQDWHCLYVGVTGAGHRRAEQHRASKDWWQDVEAAYYVHYANRGLALAVESALIGALNPIGNVQHRRVGEPMRLGPGFIKMLKESTTDPSKIDRLLAELRGPQHHIDSLPTIKDKARAMRSMSKEQYMLVRCENCGRERGFDWTDSGLFCPDCWGGRKVDIKKLDRRTTIV